MSASCTSHSAALLHEQRCKAQQQIDAGSAIEHRGRERWRHSLPREPEPAELRALQAQLQQTWGTGSEFWARLTSVDHKVVC